MKRKTFEVGVNVKWFYHGVTYTTERNKETGELYFKHPSETAGQDDHIAIEHVSHGEIISEEESA